MSWIEHQIQAKDGLLAHQHPLTPSFPSPYTNSFQKDSTPQASSGNRISPAVLFIIVILAVIFFISGLLHLLVRFLIKQPSSSSTSQSNRYPTDMSTSDALQRQLQQLFHLHDSGLDQAFIDALPVFLYKEIVGLKEPFDCAVCLCEFSEEDKLRLLPVCSHAFHLSCIDTWLLSNSTCPLCRGTLFTPGLSIENPVFDFDDPREDDGFHGDCEEGLSNVEKSVEREEIVVHEKKVFPVRLGKFRSVSNEEDQRVEAETSSSNLDARRCYSMGSFQYVVGGSSLQVALTRDRETSGNLRVMRRRIAGHNVNSLVEEDGKKLSNASKGESFSVSKIWLWSKKGKYANSSNTNMGVPSLNLSLPWTERTQGT